MEGSGFGWLVGFGFSFVFFWGGVGSGGAVSTQEWPELHEGLQVLLSLLLTLGTAEARESCRVSLRHILAMAPRHRLCNIKKSEVRAEG